MGFEAFDKSEIEQYKQEARERWGNHEAYQEYVHRQLRKTPQQSEQEGQELMAFLQTIGQIRHLPPQSDEAQQKIRDLQSLFSRNFYNCTDQILSCLGEMYVDNERFRKNIDEECGEGTALFLRDAIRIYCGKA